MDSSEVGRYWEQNAETWTRLSRMGCDVYRDHINTPAFLEMLPEVDGRTGLDIGCGEGYNTRKVAELGARMIGIDIAPTFIKHAREVDSPEPLGINYQVADGCSLPFALEAFDFVVAFMSLQDMPAQGLVIAEVRRVLKPGGFFQFSITHPWTDTPYRRWIRGDDGRAIALACGDYFVHNDGVISEWIFSHTPPELREELLPFRIPDFHRPLDFYFNGLVEAGFVIERINEPSASDEVIQRFPHLNDTRVAPHFLIVRARLPFA